MTDNIFKRAEQCISLQLIERYFCTDGAKHDSHRNEYWTRSPLRKDDNIKSGTFSIPFLTGSYSARAPLEELIKFKRNVEDLFNEFYSKCESLKGRNRIPFAVTFSMIPSREKNKEDSRNILEFEPEHLETARRQHGMIIDQ